MSHIGSQAGSAFSRSSITHRSPTQNTKPTEKFTHDPTIICIECAVGDSQKKVYCQKCFSAAHLGCSMNQNRKDVLTGKWYCNKCTIIVQKSIRDQTKPSMSSKTVTKASDKNESEGKEEAKQKVTDNHSGEKGSNVDKVTQEKGGTDDKATTKQLLMKQLAALKIC